MQLRFIVKFKLCYATFFVAAPSLQGKTQENKKDVLWKRRPRAKNKLKLEKVPTVQYEIEIRWRVPTCAMLVPRPLCPSFPNFRAFWRNDLGRFLCRAPPSLIFATFFVSSLDWRFNNVLLLSTTIFHEISCTLLTNDCNSLQY